MNIQNLSDIPEGTVLEADVVIIGSGPVGVTLARELYGTGQKVIVLESGIRQETIDYNDLLTVESIADPQGFNVVQRRKAFHGAGAELWSHDQQAYGLRCRVLGGSSHAWAGKSALFDSIDFEARDWVPNSGWPVSRDTLLPFFNRAAHHLNLGPNRYDDSLFDLMKIPAPLAKGTGRMRSFFWQFARSRRDKMDMMRFGPDFAVEAADNVRLLLNATATQIRLSKDEKTFVGLEISTLEGKRFRLDAKTGILAMGAIENARLLLASNQQITCGVGNARDTVGRYLMDHPSVPIGRVSQKAARGVLKVFSFYGVSAQGQVHMYQHGLSPSLKTQVDEHLVNCAAYVLEDRAPDDPWDALKRLLRRKSPNALADLAAVATSPGLLIKGVGMKLLSHPKMPEALKSLVINSVLKLFPTFAVAEFQNRGLPHKLTGLLIDAIVEQPPSRDNRVTLSSRQDRLGVPMARIEWHIGDTERRTLISLALMIADEFKALGLPSPDLEAWVKSADASAAAIIDMGHTCGTTRMSLAPETGVVDANCQVHGIGGLFVAGSSVFPTSGHANPTLMAVSLAVRLADHIKASATTRTS